MSAKQASVAVWLVSAVVGGITGYLAYRYLPLDSVDTDRWGQWLLAHERQTDLATIWVVVIGAAILAGVKVVSYLTIRTQRDRTDVGRALKRQKLAEAVAWGALSLIYSAVLWIAYDASTPFGVWERMGLRVLLALGIIVAVVFGVVFIRALRAERWGQTA